MNQIFINMKKPMIVLSFLLAATAAAYGQNWTQKAPVYVYGRVSAIGCSLNGQGYVGLGRIYDNSYVNDFWGYDPVSDIWTTKAPFPRGGRSGATAYAANGKIYVFFGFDNNLVCQNDVWEYNPDTDTWVQKDLFPGTARYNARGFVIGDSVIYIGTGTTDDGNNYLFDFWEYTPSTDTWLQKANFAGGKRMAAASFAINENGYLGTGLYDTYTATRDFWEYNPANDTWTRIPDLPATARFGLVSFIINNEGYVGTGDDYNNLNIEFYKYNPTETAWTPIVHAPTTARLSGVGFSIGNIGYFGTGWDKINCLNDFWAFDPSKPPQVINDNHGTLDLTLFPNPVKSCLTVDFKNMNEADKIIEICGLRGEQFLKTQTGQDRVLLNVENYPSGIYILKVVTTRSVYKEKFIKI
jgi:N-acetylneuraminic acid mutarotase